MEHLKIPRRYAGGDFLFREADPCRGIYLVKRGEVRVLMQVRPREQQVVEVVGPGSCLGLNEVMGGMSHKFSAQAIGAIEVDYIKRVSLMMFLRKHHDVCIQIVGLLSEGLHGLYARLRLVAKVEARRKRNPVSSRVH